MSLLFYSFSVVHVLVEWLEVSWHSCLSVQYALISAVADEPNQLHNHSSSHVSCHVDMHHVSIIIVVMPLRLDDGN